MFLTGFRTGDYVNTWSLKCNELFGTKRSPKARQKPLQTLPKASTAAVPPQKVYLLRAMDSPANASDEKQHRPAFRMRGLQAGRLEVSVLQRYTNLEPAGRPVLRQACGKTFGN